MKKEIFVDYEPIKLRKDDGGNYWLHLPPDITISLSDIPESTARALLITWAQGCFEAEQDSIREEICREYDNPILACYGDLVCPEERNICKSCSCFEET